MTSTVTPITLYDENTALLPPSVVLKNDARSQNRDTVSEPTLAQTSIGYLFILLATIPYAINDILVQTAEVSYGLSAMGSLFISSATQAILAITVILSNRSLRSSMSAIGDQQVYFISLFGLLCALSVIFFASALVRLPVAEADAILFLTPALTVLISYITLAEPVSLPVLVAVLVSVVGAYVISLPSAVDGTPSLGQFTNANRLEGVALAVLGALFLASSNMPIRAMGMSTSYIFSILSFSLFLFVATYLCGGYSVAFGNDSFSVMAVILSLASGVSMFLGRSLYTQGIQRCPAGQGALVGTAQLPVAIVLAYFLLAQRPTTVHFLGSLLVFSSALIIGAKQVFDGRDRRDRRLPSASKTLTPQHDIV